LKLGGPGCRQRNRIAEGVGNSSGLVYYRAALGEEGDPRDLMRPFPAEFMRIWPISTRVHKPENDDSSIIEPIEVATDAAYRP
jgi:hypothetical protein